VLPVFGTLGFGGVGFEELLSSNSSLEGLMPLIKSLI